MKAPDPLAAAVAHRLRTTDDTDLDRAFAAARVDAIDLLGRLDSHGLEGIDVMWPEAIVEALRPLAARPDDWLGAYEAVLAARPVHTDAGPALEASRGARQKRGSWYTPDVVVEAVLDAALDPVIGGIDDTDALDAVRVCDPACGGGPFLLAAARRLAARRVLLTGQPAGDAMVHVIAHAIHGADLDPGAVALARLRLTRLAGCPVPALERHIVFGDALQGPVDDQPAPPGGPRHPVVDWRRIAPDGYDVVVGNPPYRAGRLSALAADRVRLAALCPTAEYQLDPFALFLDRAARLARRRMGLLVPTTWMSNHRTRRLRGWLLATHRLEAVVEVPHDAFDAVVETAAAIFDMHAGPTLGAVPARDLAGRSTGTLLVDGARLDAPIALARDARAEAIVQAARGWTTRLGDVCEVTRGINPYHHTTHDRADIAARVHHANHRVDDSFAPELRGRDLPDAYRMAWKGDHWIQYGPWLKEPRAPRFFTGPRILVRKILGRTLCGVLIDHDMYCDQSVYIARVRAECILPPFAVLACVNSALAATLIRTRHQTHRTHFPQLKVGELRDLPLPPVPADDARWAELAADAGRLQRDGSDDRLRELIETRVEDMYGMSPDSGAR